MVYVSIEDAKSGIRKYSAQKKKKSIKVWQSERSKVQESIYDVTHTHAHARNKFIKFKTRVIIIKNYNSLLFQTNLLTFYNKIHNFIINTSLTDTLSNGHYKNH